MIEKRFLCPTLPIDHNRHPPPPPPPSSPRSFPCSRWLSVCLSVRLALSLWVRSFGMIRFWINDPRSLGSWRIKGTDESALQKDLSVPLMRHDPSDPGSLIQIRIIPKERTLCLCLSVCLSACLSVSVCLSACLSVCLSVCLSLSLSLSLSL